MDKFPPTLENNDRTTEIPSVDFIAGYCEALQERDNLLEQFDEETEGEEKGCLLYTSPSPRDA